MLINVVIHIYATLVRLGIFVSYMSTLPLELAVSQLKHECFLEVDHVLGAFLNLVCVKNVSFG